MALTLLAVQLELGDNLRCELGTLSATQNLTVRLLFSLEIIQEEL